MLIQRSPWQRRGRRRSGCTPLTLLTGALAGLLVIAFGWLAGLVVPPPQPAMVGLESIRRAFDSGDLDAAVDAAEKALAASPGQSDAVLMLVRSLIYRSYTDWNRSADRQRALEIAASAASRAPSNPDAQSALAFA